MLTEPVVGGEVASIDVLYIGDWIEERDTIEIMHATLSYWLGDESDEICF